MSLLVIPGCLLAAEKQSEANVETDMLTLSAMLIKDGNYQRALTTLANVQITEDTQPQDVIRYHTLRGLAELNMQQFKLAQKDFYQAIKSGQSEPVIYIYLAQAHYSLNEYDQTVSSIDKAGDVIKNYPALMEIKAQSQWLLGRKQKSWSTLNQARGMFPGDHRFLRRQVFYLVDLGFYRRAAELGKEYLSLSNASAEDYLAIGNALRLSHQFDQATAILEKARLLFQDNPTVAKVLAHTYLDMELPGTAASILEQAAYFDNTLVSESAELYRRAGQLNRAMLLNARIDNQKVKLKQRVAILVGMKNYERVAQMEPDLKRVGLMDDQPILYALAYAQFASGQYSGVEPLLNRLTEPELFKKATELRRAIQECQEQPANCV
ncbi:MAG: hypothetical protein K0U68_16260 [Gammaproteobacteria bacterium]|nr:hypothetical protein [Gammaproteobacteria bacterium]